MAAQASELMHQRGISASVGVRELARAAPARVTDKDSELRELWERVSQLAEAL